MDYSEENEVTLNLKDAGIEESADHFEILEVH